VGRIENLFYTCDIIKMCGACSVCFEHDNCISIMYVVRVSYSNVYVVFKCILKK
jgi:hypothetical protein